jgi:hypothetical protein
MFENFPTKFDENLHLVTHVIYEPSVDANFRRMFMFLIPKLTYIVTRFSDYKRGTDW